MTDLMCRSPATLTHSLWALFTILYLLLLHLHDVWLWFLFFYYQVVLYEFVVRFRPLARRSVLSEFFVRD